MDRGGVRQMVSGKGASEGAIVSATTAHRGTPAGAGMTARLLGPVLGVALLTGQAVAADPPPAAPATAPAPVSDPWQFQLTFYGWATGIDGNVGIRSLPTVPVNASFVDLVSNLQGILPVSFVAKKDNWTILFDFFWTDLGVENNLPGPLLGKVNADLRQTLASIAFGYRLPVGDPNFDLSATAGFRYQRLSLDTSLYSLAIPFAASESDVKDWLDPVFGLSLQYRINDKWFVNALGDIGGFGLGSKLTWQAFGAVGYNWTQNWSTAVGYRALYTDYQSVTGLFSNFRYETTIHGPFMSLAYHF